MENQGQLQQRKEVARTFFSFLLWNFFLLWTCEEFLDSFGNEIVKIQLQYIVEIGESLLD